MAHQSEPPIAIDAVVPNFNYESYVGDAIESLLRQSPPFSKIIVVNDGSTDNSLEVIDKYRDVVTVLDTRNSGQLGACLKGLAHVEADYVYFMDSDDMACEDLTRQLLPLLAARPTKVQFMLQSVTETGTPNGSIFPRYPNGYSMDQIQRDNFTLGLYICAPTSGNVFSVRHLREMPLSSMRERDFIDFTPNVMIGYMGDVISCDLALTQYRVHGENHSEPWVDMSKDRLERELEWFVNSWAETKTFLPHVMVVPENTSYVLERRIMIDVLDKRKITVRAARAFGTCIVKSSLPAKVKAVNLAWIILLIVARGSARYRVMQAKRLPQYRPQLMNTIFWPRGRAQRAASAAQ